MLRGVSWFWKRWRGVGALTSVALHCAACARPAAAPCNCPAYGSGAAATQSSTCDAQLQQPPGASPPATDGSADASSASPQLASAKTETELLARYEGRRPKTTQLGKATYYSNKLSGRKTASGETYNPASFTAAHKKLPFDTVVRVVRTDTNRYVYVRITDRGPFAGRERIIDLSYIAAERLGMIRAGVVPVRVEVLD
jgi:rare lipoprotein A